MGTGVTSIWYGLCLDFLFSPHVSLMSFMHLHISHGIIDIWRLVSERFGLGIYTVGILGVSYLNIFLSFKYFYFSI